MIRELRLANIFSKKKHYTGAPPPCVREGMVASVPLGEGCALPLPNTPPQNDSTCAGQQRGSNNPGTTWVKLRVIQSSPRYGGAATRTAQPALALGIGDLARVWHLACGWHLALRICLAFGIWQLTDTGHWAGTWHQAPGNQLVLGTWHFVSIWHSALGIWLALGNCLQSV